MREHDGAGKWRKGKPGWSLEKGLEGEVDPVIQCFVHHFSFKNNIGQSSKFQPYLVFMLK